MRACANVVAWPAGSPTRRSAPAGARTARGGALRHSAMATTTAWTLRAVFHLALRRTKGLVGSTPVLFGLDLTVPTCLKM